MKKTINLREFKEGFVKYGRENQFSEEGLESIFNFIEEWEEDLSTQFDYDVIAICCEYTEYPNFKELQDDYPEINNLEDLDLYLISKNGSIIINNF